MSLPFVVTAIHHEALASTSNEARRLLSEGTAALPLIVTARQQTVGRGRGTNTWWSDEGSLTFTLGLDPAQHGLREAHFPCVALATAVAIIDALEQEGGLAPGRLGIRWPNDVEAEGKKLGGILPERVECRGQPRLAIGIGLNLTTRLEHAPEAVRRMATTVHDLGGRVEADPFLGAILGRMAPILSTLARDDPSLAARWMALDALRGQAIRVDLGSSILSGTARGLDPRGGLRCETPDGVRTLYGGQVLRDL